MQQVWLHGMSCHVRLSSLETWFHSKQQVFCTGPASCLQGEKVEANARFLTTAEW